VEDAISPGSEKFSPPVTTHVVDRPRLHALLTDEIDAPVTVVAATAGWGKTLLAASWLAADTTDRVTAWVTLEPIDDSPQIFWRTVAMALTPSVGRQAAEVLHQVTASDVPEEDLPGTIAAALRYEPRQVVLVLDNLHEIGSPEVHSGLLRLVAHPPPSLLLLITTRRDPPWPLAQFRLAGLVAEVRTSDLAFRPDEAAALFAQLMVDVDPSQLARLIDRTEGWAAGLRLVALHLKGVDDVETAVAAFSGDDHSVAGYLLTEVLERQSPELLAFLEKISVVDLVCADLADSLTGRQDGAAMLADIAASHLFMQAVGRPGRWYRLHRLIADILRARPGGRRERRDLHRRAAEWFRRNDMPLDAIRSAIAGRIWSLAADCAGEYTLALAMGGRGRELERVLTAIPGTVLSAHAELAAALAGARAAYGSGTEVAALVESARAAADKLPPRRASRTRTLLDLTAGALARIVGDWEATVAFNQRVPVEPWALAELGMTGAQLVPVVVNSNLGTAAYWVGDFSTAERHLAAALDVEMDHVVLAQLNSSALCALLQCERGELDPAEAAAREVIGTASSAGLAKVPQMAGAYLTMARVTLDRGDDEGADDWLGRIAGMGAFGPEPHVRLAGSVLLALRRESAGKREAALAGLRAQAEDDRRRIPRALLEWSTLTEIALLARSGDTGTASRLLEQMGHATTAAGVLASARLYLLLGDVQTAAAIRADAPAAHHVRARVDEAVLDALLAQAVGDEERALDRTEDALAAAVPWALRRPFLDEGPHLRALLERRIERGTVAPAFAVDLLERMSGPPAGGSDVHRALVDPITEREQTVLRYLASTLPTAEIAAELYVSVSTVKTHQRSLYRKLAVSGRRDAVRRARLLHLL
jgi:LuxR family transcriptional regulator, maltose regulon positive regulatory protein